MWENVIVDRKLNKDDILKLISQEEIFYKYLGIYPEIGKKYINPLRENHTPNTEFIWINNVLYLRDWGWENEKNLNCFGVVQYLNKCNYEEALTIIYWDYLKHNTIKIPENKRNDDRSYVQHKLLDIKIKVKPYSKEGLDFWSCNEEFNVNETILKKYQIYECEYVWFNNKQIKCFELTFAYQIEKGIFQIYIPFAKDKRYKFRTSKLKDVIPFYSLCNKNIPIIITKSYKDAYVLRRMGYNACCFLNEGIINYIEGDFIWLFDNDEKGVKTRNKYLELYKGSSYLEIPKEYGKDCWEFVYNYGKKEFEKWMNL